MSEMYNTFGFGFLPPDEQQKLIRKNLITTGQIAERDGQTFYTGAGDLRKSKAQKMVTENQRRALPRQRRHKPGES